MPSIKDGFALAYLAAAALLTLLGVHVIFNRALDLSWGGVLLIVVPVIGVNGNRLLRRERRGHRYVGVLSLLALAGFIITVTSLLGGLAIGPRAFLAAVLGLVLHALYRFWFLATDDQPPAA